MPVTGTQNGAAAGVGVGLRGAGYRYLPKCACAVADLDENIFLVPVTGTADIGTDGSGYDLSSDYVMGPQTVNDGFEHRAENTPFE